VTKDFTPEMPLGVENLDLTHLATLAYSRQLQKGISTAEVCLADLFIYRIELLGFSL